MWSKKKRCGSLGDQDLDCGACKLIMSQVASFIIHFGSASGNDASAASTVEADPKNSAPSDFEETSSIIKLEDLVKLVSDVQPSFKDLDSPEDDPGIIVNDSNEDKDYEVHTTENGETKDTSVPKSSSPRSTQVQELTN
ncbi:hypothetical protein Tco_0975156 [Tanacetum coccineum]|uniref:Uncharacterized protein n=1 Tax=Tanacetum coccineum TaxID=301880 RepID=A0ABQ5EDJ9_9ASTR